MAEIFVGSAAVAAGRVTRYDLRARYIRVFPDVYASNGVPLTLTDRVVAAWLWSQQQGVISGLAAAALHDAKWVDDHVDVELNWRNHKAPPGVVIRNETLHEGETELRRGVVATTVERTAFDLARRGTVAAAVARLDALAAATNFRVDDVLALAARHPHVKGLRQVAHVLGMIDAGAQSPKETWLRLLLIAAGFPRPVTQIPVLGADGRPRYYLDMGWPELMVAVEYDGEQHRVDRGIYRDDLIRSEFVAARGWRRIRVVADDRGPDIVSRVHAAWEAALR